MTELDAATGALVQVISGPRYGFAAYPLYSDGTHVWIPNSHNRMDELSAATGALVRVIGSPYRFNGPDAASSDGTHVTVAVR